LVGLLLGAWAWRQRRRAREEAERREQAALALLADNRREAVRAERAARKAEAEKAAEAAAEQAAEAARRTEARALERAAAAARQAAEREAADREAQARADAAREAAERQRQAMEAQRAETAAQAARLARAAEQAERQHAERQAPDAPPAAPASAPRPRPPEETLVMVADDSKVVRVKTSRLLAQHHYRVVLAEDGEQAARLIEDEVPLVLITDVEMPGMDGFALTRHVRSHPRARHIPIIMITSADDRLKAAAAQAGVTLVLGKPYPEDALLACIEQAQQLAGAAAA
jgi:CheY-like chemotaxis protein